MRCKAPDAVPTRLLTAEAAAAAALALIQHPAVWEALQTLALIAETVDNQPAADNAMVGGAIRSILADVPISDVDANRAVQLLEAVDKTARTWATLAYTTASYAPA